MNTAKTNNYPHPDAALSQLANMLEGVLARSEADEHLDVEDAVEVMTHARNVIRRAVDPPLRVRVRNGAVESVENIPRDLLVQVMDYDCETDGEPIEDEHGDMCYLSYWDSEFEARLAGRCRTPYEPSGHAGKGGAA